MRRPSKVRQLAQRYANNELSFNDYRIKRRELIDSIVAGAEPLYERRVLTVLRLHRLRVKPKRGLAAVVTGILVLTLAAWLAWPVTSSTAVPRPAIASHAAFAPGARLIRVFLKKKHWHRADLAELRAHWRGLSASERRATRHTVWYRRLKAALRNRLNQQQALMPLERDGAARGRAAQLIKLARTLAR